MTDQLNNKFVVVLNKKIPVGVLMNTFIYDPKSIESKWQEVWEKRRIYQPDLKRAKKPYYNLMMFPYPSAEGLHVGNMYAFTGADVHGRFKRMQGYDVFEPIGLDGFGIHSENYAIKVGRHPIEHAKVSEKHFYDQLHMIGNGFAWDQKLETYDPEYYKWTQWLFVQMYKHGLAYRKSALVNWCPSCKTVLSDEQVEGGVCERCKTPTIRKETEQWFFKITNYANQLLENLEKIVWPKKIKVAQRNWIGKKEGINITYQLVDSDETITCFTTTPVNFGATFLVVSTEHPIIKKIIAGEIRSLERYQVATYVEDATKKTEQQRKMEEKKKTGVFTGIYATNHVTDEKIPVWVSDFVLMSVGTGAIQGCPGHDLRDFEFAKKFGLPIKRVVVDRDGDVSPIERIEQVIESGMPGKMINSDFLNGMEFSDAMQKTMDYFEEKGWGKRVVTYHLRDWLISRQRYWGPPIPMIYCANCAKNDERRTMNDEPMAGWFPVPEDQLPVLLPYVKDFQPIGEGKTPLEKAPKEWSETTCPNCSGKATRSTEVSDTFLDSSWYFLRYPSIGSNPKHEIRNSKQFSKSKISNSKRFGFRNSDFELPWNLEITRQWLPVHAYIGGAEHAVLHLLYARFVWMALKDWGCLPVGKKEEGRRSSTLRDSDPNGKKEEGNKTSWEEPFPFLFSHGLVIKDGAKMSKSRGNVVTPDEYISRFGADCLRMYLMFLGPYDQGGDFRDTGMAGMYRFLERIWRAFQKVTSDKLQGTNKTDSELLVQLHRTIKKMTEDLPKFKFNTSIALLMEFMNAWEGKGKAEGQGSRDEGREINLSQEDSVSLLKLLAPFAPHIADELYHRVNLQDDRSIHQLEWPKYDEKLAELTTIEMPIQVNGKTRAVIGIDAGDASDETTVTRIARSHDAIVKHLTGKTVKSRIFIPSKTLNFVIQDTRIV